MMAFDVGTTYSGASYAVLDPGLVPEIHGVTRYTFRRGNYNNLPNRSPGSQRSKRSAAIPKFQPSSTTTKRGPFVQSVLKQQKTSSLRKRTKTNIPGLNGRCQYIARATKAISFSGNRFKLHLRPKALASSHIRDDDLPPLPAIKTAEEILADFINYLYISTRTYIQETHPGGGAFWKSVENNVDYVLSLPNGWEGPQQAQMRRAAIKAGLVANEAQAQERISFVTEGEASLHYCIQKGITKEAVQVRPFPPSIVLYTITLVLRSRARALL